MNEKTNAQLTNDVSVLNDNITTFNTFDSSVGTTLGSYTTNASLGTTLGAYATNASIGNNMIAKSAITIVDTSMYWTAPDASIWSWQVAKV